MPHYGHWIVLCKNDEGKYTQVTSKEFTDPKELEKYLNSFYPDRKPTYIWIDNEECPSATHIDDWLDDPFTNCEDNEDYAKFIFEYMRFPAYKIGQYEKFMKQFKLFCMYDGEQYRVTGASRMGDIWLSKNFDRNHGYDLRVDLKHCSGWSDKPRS